MENNQRITNLFIAANRDERMYQAYSDYLNGWENAGGSLFRPWLDIGQYSKWGSWGALEHVDQEESPKYNALLDFVNRR